MSIPVSALDNLADLVTPPEEILWREGPGGKQLAYVDARWVMGVLDTLVGPANWRRLHTIVEGGKVACGIGFLIDMGDGQPPVWVDKWDGAGETDIEGEKGSFSDSFKRAAVNWNIGRDLYAKKPGGAARQAPVQQQPQRAADAPQYGTQAAPVNTGWDVADVQTAVAGYPEDSCPFHHKAWTDGKYGWYCQSKASNGSPENKNGYCNAKPSRAWMAAHEK